jgi:hypothetical protein
MDSKIAYGMRGIAMTLSSRNAARIAFGLVRGEQVQRQGIKRRNNPEVGAMNEVTLRIEVPPYTTLITHIKKLGGEPGTVFLSYPDRPRRTQGASTRTLVLMSRRDLAAPREIRL